MAMARVQIAGLETRARWVHLIAKGVSVLYHRGFGRVSVSGVYRSGVKIPWGSCLQALDGQDINRYKMLYLWSVSTKSTRVAGKARQGA